MRPPCFAPVSARSQRSECRASLQSTHERWSDFSSGHRLRFDGLHLLTLDTEYTEIAHAATLFTDVDSYTTCWKIVHLQRGPRAHISRYEPGNRRSRSFSTAFESESPLSRQVRDSRTRSRARCCGPAARGQVRRRNEIPIPRPPPPPWHGAPLAGTVHLDRTWVV